ncbi:hypothetical protein Btru_012193 [Bulinus truncatus]|nr:hypothetical protein Btru_012193 [Bulinus truncatus]
MGWVAAKMSFKYFAPPWISRCPTSTSASKSPRPTPLAPETDFILAYLCCENYFTDVTYDYIKYLNSTFLQYQAGLTDEVILIDHAKFIKMCYPGLNGYLLTKEDYLNWSSNGRTVARCRV